MGVARISTSSANWTMRSSISSNDIWHPEQPAIQSEETFGFAMENLLQLINILNKAYAIATGDIAWASWPFQSASNRRPSRAARSEKTASFERIPFSGLIARTVA